MTVRAPRALAAVLALAVALPACGGLPAADRGPEWPTPVRGAVVAEHPLATLAGLSILESGGNAADAAVATALALAVVYPQAGNLGGGGFALWVPHGGVEGAVAFDFRETAPRRLVPELFLDESGEVVDGRSTDTHLAVGVPGSPAGLHALHAAHGRLRFETVAEPAIRYARDGFAVDGHLARDLRDPDLWARLTAHPAAAALFYPGGEPVAEGDRLRQPELAATLERLADLGPAGFYAGPVSAALLAEMERGGGVLDGEDLAVYAPVEREPLVGWFRGQQVVTMPPPSSGGVALLQVLGILEGLPLDSERLSAQDGDPAAPGVSERVAHWWIEAQRRAFADRAQHLGDPDSWDVPVDALLSPEWIAALRVSIGERAEPGVRPWGAAAVEGGGETTHLSALDSDGNAVSLTTTLNTSFGTGILVPGAGFLLNNEMDDFSIQPGVPNTYGLVGSEANQLGPGRRPLSSMTPTVLLADGHTVSLVIGSPGGPRIITSVIEVILRVLVHDQDVEAAIRAPRLHQQWKPEFTRFEPGWDEALLEALGARGHDVRREDGRWSSVQAIRVPEPGGEPEAFSDPRRGGAAGIEDRGVTPPAIPGRR